MLCQMGMLGEIGGYRYHSLLVLLLFLLVKGQRNDHRNKCSNNNFQSINVPRFVSYDWNCTLWVAFLVLQIINCSCPFHMYYCLVCYLMFSIFFVCSDLPATSVRELLLPAIQNLLKDLDALDPAHKEALEIILKERSGGTLEAISKVMGAHLGIASSVTSLFGEGGLLGKKDSGDPPPEPVESPRAVPPPPAEDTRFMKIMRGNFTDMLRSKAKNQEDTSTGQ